MAKDPMFQILCLTSTWKAPGLMPNTYNLYFHVLQSFLLNTKVFISHVFQSFSLNTTKKLMCSRASHSTQNISSIMCFRFHNQHKQTHTHISYAIGLCPVYQQINMFICSVVFDPIYQNKTSR